jgi:hypothetical protein
VKVKELISDLKNKERTSVIKDEMNSSSTRLVSSFKAMDLSAIAPDIEEEVKEGGSEEGNEDKVHPVDEVIEPEIIGFHCPELPFDDNEVRSPFEATPSKHQDTDFETPAKNSLLHD